MGHVVPVDARDDRFLSREWIATMTTMTVMTMTVMMRQTPLPVVEWHAEKSHSS